MGMGLRSLKTCLALIVFTATVSGASANGSPEPAVANYQETRTRFIVANGTRYAYRRFGNESGVPLVLFAHFRASMDNWDPQLLNRRSEEHTSELQSLMRISYAVFCLKKISAQREQT